MTITGATSSVDWKLAGRVGRSVAGPDPLVDSYLSSSLVEDFSQLTSQAESLVAQHTGLRAPGFARARVLDRHEWLDANLVSLRRLLSPLLERISNKSSRFAPLQTRVTAAEMGFLLGWMSKRVLGQYDVLVPESSDQDRGDSVYYVGTNILLLEKKFSFRPRDFRLWIAIHEVTHRAQFLGVPWMQSYYTGLVKEALSHFDPDPRALSLAWARVVEAVRRGNNPLAEGGIAALVASPEQQEGLRKIQALMSLLEGHGNRVMNELGQKHVVGQKRMAQVLDARRKRRGVSAIFSQLVGLDAKMRQYEVGEAFVTAVELAAGPRALDTAWRGPEFLPTVTELIAPEVWLKRVGLSVSVS